jgi:hypothetical protein
MVEINKVCGVGYWIENLKKARTKESTERDMSGNEIITRAYRI